MDLDTQLSPHFSLREMVYSETAQRRSELLELQEAPPEGVVENLRHLCLATLEPLRSGLGGAPIGVTSGYRCPALNRAVGGATHSQHLSGQAADIHLPASYPHALGDYALSSAREFVHGQVRERTGRYVRLGVGANFYLFAWAALHLAALDIDQLIHEYGAPGAPAWVHVSSSPVTSNRGEILRIYADGNHVTMTTRLSVESALRLGT